jgi:pimeloyl-ACP methyl ester carboxylesterase
MLKISTYLFYTFILLLITGCSSVGSYNSGEELNEAMHGKLINKCKQYEGVARNPVIVVHGFLGSKLKNRRLNRVVWGKFSTWDSLTGFSDRQLYDLSLKMSKSNNLTQLDESVEPFAFLEKISVQFMGFSIQINAYEDMLKILRNAGYVQYGKPLPKTKHFYSLFPFYYDWRRDLPYNAARLEKYILEKRLYMQQKYKKLYGINNYDVQFDIVAHSMGGLVARYFLRYGGNDLPADGSIPKLDWKGSRYIDKLLIVGTPNAGYLDTCLELINGLQVAPGTPTYPPAVVGTFASIYQMMPVYGFRTMLYDDDPNGAEVDIFDPKVWIKLKWGLANPDQDKILKKLLPKIKDPKERRAIALDHLQKCLKRAKQFQRAMQLKASPPDDVAMFLFAGDAIPTRRTAMVNRKTGTVKVTEFAPGDGKILTTSARFDLREDGYWTPQLRSPITWRGTFLLHGAHMGITKSSTFNSNASFCLLVTPSVKQDKKDKRSLLLHQNLPTSIKYLGDGKFDNRLLDIKKLQ